MAFADAFLQHVATFEGGGFSRGLRETTNPIMFQLPLVLHVLGMGVLAGSAYATGLALLGAAPGVPREALRRMGPLQAAAFVLSLASGLILLAAYPTKAFTNPIFYIKLALVAASVAVQWAVLKVALAPGASPAAAKPLAAASIGLWTATIIFARLLAYTYRHLLAGLPGGF